MKPSISLVTFLLTLLALPLFAGPPLIVTGWDSPNAAQFREHLAEFEKLGLFEGTNIDPTRRPKDGAVVSAKNAFSREPWRWEEFADALADLRAAKTSTTTCRETFLMLYANPGDVDWFDDAGWRKVVNHWRILARLAKQGGLRGLLYDAEPYTKPHSQFRYGAQAGREQHSFAEYRAQARVRGGEVMRAVAEEFPEVKIFCYRLFSDLLPMLESGDFTRALEADTYGLQPAFVDGWMEALPPGLTIVEGTEDIGYRLRVKSTGRGQGALAIGWKTSDGKWTAHAHNEKFFPTGPADADGWREITGLVEAPPSAGQVVFIASAAAQLTASDRCEFDNAELVAVPAGVDGPLATGHQKSNH